MTSSVFLGFWTPFPYIITCHFFKTPPPPDDITIIIFKFFIEYPVHVFCHRVLKSEWQRELDFSISLLVLNGNKRVNVDEVITRFNLSRIRWISLGHETNWIRVQTISIEPSSDTHPYHPETFKNGLESCCLGSKAKNCLLFYIIWLKQIHNKIQENKSELFILLSIQSINYEENKVFLSHSAVRSISSSSVLIFIIYSTKTTTIAFFLFKKEKILYKY